MTPMHKPIITLFTLLLLWLPVAAMAQDALSLSVTPTLFDVSVNPGQRWQSDIRVVNPNPYDITVYAQPVLLSASGERGVSTFTPITETEGLDATLAEWLEITSEPVVVPQQQTASVPFSVDVPRNAAPGGQYAAVLISTQPPVSDTDGVTRVQTTQAVSSLFFMRVEGEVVEEGQIRAFRAESSFASRPENKFSLRFENQGTVHLQPQGDITVYNMWGETRGVIPVNQRTEFGKVLPDSVREYNFAWTGEYSLVDIGRYRAEVTLGYGSDQKSFVQRTAYFWVIPIYGLLMTLGAVAVVLLVIAWLVRLYIKRMLVLAGVPERRAVRRASRVTARTQASDINLSADKRTVGLWQRWSLPLRDGWRDMRARLQQPAESESYIQTARTVLYDYRWFWLGVVFMAAASALAVWYYQTVAAPERSFESQVVDHTDTVTSVVTSEDLYWEKLQRGEAASLVSFDESLLLPVATSTTLELVNVSGTPGAAASIAYESRSYWTDVPRIQTDLERRERRSVVVYSSAAVREAERWSQALDGALLSVLPEAQDQAGATITIYVGADVVVDE